MRCSFFVKNFLYNRMNQNLSPPRFLKLGTSNFRKYSLNSLKAFECCSLKKNNIFMFKIQKKSSLFLKKKCYTQIILKCVKIKLWKFEEDCLKTEGGDI